MRSLSARILRAINPAILLETPERPSAACSLEPDKDFDLLYRSHQFDTSFTRQIKSVTEDYESLSKELKEPPGVFIFTAFSAIPFADMVRGYYSTAGESLPRIGHIRASRRKSWTTEEAQHRESARLLRVIDGHRHVCVVEEYVSSGQTLRLANNILTLAGVEHVTAIRGRWDSCGNSPREVKLHQMSSDVSSKMHKLGEAAFVLGNNS